MFAVLNINKPPGMTSRDVVDRVQRRVRPDKAGHAGTLDPIATGVLLVCIGQATRLIEYAHQLPKSYRATFLLGRRSETDDIERDVEVVEGAPQPGRAEVDAVLPQFVGEILQRPPRHSAVKIAGRRAYQLARQGVDFEPEPKTVQIHRLVVVRYEYPELVLDIDCGSGTYVRSLGRDVAAALGTCAVMASLERTSIGDFHIADATTMADLDADWQCRLLPPTRLTTTLPALTLAAHEVRELQHGRAIRAGRRLDGVDLGPDAHIAAVDDCQNLVAILRRRDSDELTPMRNFTQPE